MKWKIVILLILSGTGNVLFGSQSDTTKYASQTPEGIVTINPWYASGNPAGLDKLRLTGTNLFEAGYSSSADNFRYIYEPDKHHSTSVSTWGLKRIGNVVFDGNFAYRNSVMENVYFNSIYDYSPFSPYFIGDTVGGTQRLETFELKGAFSYNFRKNISVGLFTKYENSLGSKQKDPRNLNKISKLKVGTGLIIDLGQSTLGLSGGLIRYNNEISFSVMENARHNLFQFMGMGYYRAQVNIYSYSSAYFGSGGFAGLQHSLAGSKGTLFSKIDFEKYTEEVRSGTGFRIIEGVTDRVTIELVEQYQIKSVGTIHNFNLEAGFSSLSGAEVLQRYVPVNTGVFTYDTLITDSWVKGKHVVLQIEGDLSYNYSKYDKKGYDKSGISGGVKCVYLNIDHNPVETHGTQNSLTLMAYGEVHRSFEVGKFKFTPVFSSGYRTLISGESSYTVTAKSFPKIPESEFTFHSANYITTRIQMKTQLRTGSRDLNATYLTLSGGYDYAPELPAELNSNRSINITIGTIF